MSYLSKGIDTIERIMSQGSQVDQVMTNDGKNSVLSGNAVTSTGSEGLTTEIPVINYADLSGSDVVDHEDAIRGLCIAQVFERISTKCTELPKPLLRDSEQITVTKLVMPATADIKEATIASDHLIVSFTKDQFKTYLAKYFSGEPARLSQVFASIAKGKVTIDALHLGIQTSAVKHIDFLVATADSRIK